jgi:hypothetical protein
VKTDPVSLLLDDLVEARRKNAELAAKLNEYEEENDALHETRRSDFNDMHEDMVDMHEEIMRLRGQLAEQEETP